MLSRSRDCCFGFVQICRHPYQFPFRATFQTNGVLANTQLGSRYFLLQQNYVTLSGVPSYGYCAQFYSATGASMSPLPHPPTATATASPSTIPPPPNDMFNRYVVLSRDSEGFFGGVSMRGGNAEA